MKVVKAWNGQGTTRAVNLPDQSLLLLLPLSEAQVDRGTGAKQAMSLCLDSTSLRRHGDVKLLNDLPVEEKNNNTEMLFRPCKSFHNVFMPSASCSEMPRYCRHTAGTRDG